MEKIKIVSNQRVEFIDITERVRDVVISKRVEEGICMIFCPHTTAALTINENADPSVRKDIIAYLDRIVPVTGGYSHYEGNSDAHIKSSLLGVSLVLGIKGGDIVLGKWQGIYFCEFDGPRRRQLFIKIMSG